MTLAGAVWATSQTPATSSTEPSLFDLSLEELMAVDITATSGLQDRKCLAIVHRALCTLSRPTGFGPKGVRTLEDLLRRIPGVQLSPNRQGHTSVWVRGVQDRYNSKILLLVDSVPMQDIYYSNFLIDDMYPIELIDTIEVLAGPSSVLYGANAFAGIIDIKTKKKANEATFSVTSDHAYSGAAHVSSDALSVFAKYLGADDGFVPEFGRDGELRRQDQDPDRRLVMVDVKYDLTEELTLHLGKTHYKYPWTYSKYFKTRTVTRSPTTASNELHAW